MWRADNYDTPVAPGASLDSQPWWSSDLAHQVSVGDSEATPVNQAAMAWEGWWSQIAALGGPSPLIHFQDYPENRVDISRGHPGGLARFLAGSPTLLANLIRDDVARRPAHRAALRLVDHALELKHSRGIDSLALGIGLVEWHHEGEQYCGPLLMRPVRVRRRGSDIEITLKRSRVRLNPGVQRAFADQLHVSLDAAAFVALTDDGGAFKPNPALDRLRDLTAHRDDVSVSARLVISSFAELADPLLDDVKNLHHPIIDALGGNGNAITELRHARVPVEIVHPDSTPAETDRAIVESDSEQDAIVQNILAGNSLVVRALPGAGGTQTIVNALGSLVAVNKRVLLVTPRSATSEAVKARLADVGLQGMAVDTTRPARDIIASISRNEKAKKPALKDVEQAYERLRKVILRYREALTRKDSDLGVSALQCFRRLGTLSLMDSPPETTARLERDALVALAPGLGQAAELLKRAAELGEFRYGPADSPWYGVSFDSFDDAKKSQERARRLATESVPRLLERIGPILAQTPLPDVTTVGQMGVFVHLLMDMRDTLDRFQPTVFDRSLKDLITATGPKELAKSMPRLQRQRLKGLAKEHVRPGVSVPDLHESLVKIQAQRELWNRYVDTGHQPSVPAGLADVHVVCVQIEQDLHELDRVLGRRGKGERLADMPSLVMLELLKDLSVESEILQSLERRREVQDHLEEMHLGPLVEDLATRHIEGGSVALELELAWWRGALETILAKEEALLGSDKDVLVRLEADFRLVDEAHAAGNAQLLAWQLAERWSLGLMDWPDEARELKKILKNQTASLHSITSLAPHLTKALAPIWISTPYEVHHIPDTTRFDLVVVMDSGVLSVAESLGSLRRAPQVVVVGDPVSQTPSQFALGVRTDRDEDAPDGDALHEDSLFARLSSLLPTLSLTTSYRASGDELARVVTTAFYGGIASSMPWAGSYLGHPSLVVDHLEDGQGMPDSLSGVVESVEAEVRAVVQHVIDHVVTRPGESLMVLSASAKHATRVHEAVSASAQTRPELAQFIAQDSSEPFVVATLEQARGFSRDRVIFSLGYGRTPHGRVLSDLGPLSAPGGERLLAGVFTSARRHLRVISCVAVEDLRDERLTPTTRALGDVLHLLDAPVLTREEEGDPDPLLVDLARRLEALGMTTQLGYRGVIPLVAQFGGYCIAVDTDQSLMAMPVREALRARPHALARSGWHYVRAFAMELFMAPDDVAHRIGVLVGAVTDSAELTHAQ